MHSGFPGGRTSARHAHVRMRPRAARAVGARSVLWLPGRLLGDGGDALLCFVCVQHGMAVMRSAAQRCGRWGCRIAWRRSGPFESALGPAKENRDNYGYRTTRCNRLRHVATCCAMLRHVAPCCAMLRHVATCCAMLRHVVAHLLRWRSAPLAVGLAQVEGDAAAPRRVGASLRRWARTCLRLKPCMRLT